jgi:putative endonuclease
MFSGRFIHVTIRVLDWLAERTLPLQPGPSHQHTGRRGEEDAYFYLRRKGYVMVARNFRTPLRRGEIDLIGWDKDVLCFIEVKTRTTRDVKPAEAAVDRDKQRALVRVARQYLSLLQTARNASLSPAAQSVVSTDSFPLIAIRPAPSCQFRFDVVSVYYDHQCGDPQFELFRNAFAVA